MRTVVCAARPVVGETDTCAPGAVGILVGVAVGAGVLIGADGGVVGFGVGVGGTGVAVGGAVGNCGGV